MRLFPLARFGPTQKCTGTVTQTPNETPRFFRDDNIKQKETKECNRNIRKRSNNCRSHRVSHCHAAQRHKIQERADKANKDIRREGVMSKKYAESSRRSILYDDSKCDSDHLGGSLEISPPSFEILKWHTPLQLILNFTVHGQSIVKDHDRLFNPFHASLQHLCCRLCAHRIDQRIHFLFSHVNFAPNLSSLIHLALLKHFE